MGALATALVDALFKLQPEPAGAHALRTGLHRACYDCGRKLAGDLGWLDYDIPEQYHHLLQPRAKLCLLCVATRVSAAGLTKVPLLITSGPFEIRARRPYHTWLPESRAQGIPGWFLAWGEHSLYSIVRWDADDEPDPITGATGTWEDQDGMNPHVRYVRLPALQLGYETADSWLNQRRQRALAERPAPTAADPSDSRQHALPLDSDGTQPDDN